jgi:hypothetical protein
MMHVVRQDCAMSVQIQSFLRFLGLFFTTAIMEVSLQQQLLLSPLTKRPSRMRFRHRSKSTLWRKILLTNDVVAGGALLLVSSLPSFSSILSKTYSSVHASLSSVFPTSSQYAMYASHCALLTIIRADLRLLGKLWLFYQTIYNHVRRESRKSTLLRAGERLCAL